MNAFKRMALVAGALLAMGSAEAQYTFSAQIVISGNCFSSASRTAERNIRQIVNEANSKLRAVPLTKTECMAMSQQFAGEMAVYSFNEYGCSIKLVITPCVCTGCQEEVSSPDQGGSFNSANAGSEVRDWADDVDARLKALDNQRATPPPSQVEAFFGKGTGDKLFDDALKKSLGDFELPNNEVKLPDNFELLANMENVQRYLSMTSDLAKRYIDYPDPDHLVAWFHEEFKHVSDFDLGEIMNKLESQRSPAEKQALIDYQVFRRLLADKMLKDLEPYIAVQEETRVYEMSVLSENCYGDSEHNWINSTNYREVSTSELDENNPMRAFSEVIDRCNKTPGFHAELYYNNVTGEYTVAFEGSELNPEDREDFWADWKDCNALQGFGFVPKQYFLARVIAEELPKDVKVNFTGHSLGGGLASIAGAASGNPTYTFNPEGVNTTAIHALGLENRIKPGNHDIKVYQTDDDPLTSIQEGDKKPWLIIGTVTVVSLAVPEPVSSAVNGYIIGGAVNGTVLSKAIGDKQTVETHSGHSIKPMIPYFDGGRGHLTSWQNSIRRAGYGTELQTEDNILIIMQE